MRDIAEHLPIIVVGVAVVIVVVQLLTSSNVYGQIGRGGLSLDQPPESPPASALERDEDIRQLLEARNARRARQGRPPIDVETELRRLVASTSGATRAPDSELAQEVRQLVIARNARRQRKGQPPLDV